jgi:hypothetical protein
MVSQNTKHRQHFYRGNVVYVRVSHVQRIINMKYMYITLKYSMLTSQKTGRISIRRCLKEKALWGPCALSIQQYAVVSDVFCVGHFVIIFSSSSFYQQSEWGTFFKLMCWVRHRPPVLTVSWWGSLQWVNPLQPSIRSTGQFFFSLLLCCCSSTGCNMGLLWFVLG